MPIIRFPKHTGTGRTQPPTRPVPFRLREQARVASNLAIHPREASGRLVGPTVFKTGERSMRSLAGSIPVRLRYRDNGFAEPKRHLPLRQLRRHSGGFDPRLVEHGLLDRAVEAQHESHSSPILCPKR